MPNTPANPIPSEHFHDGALISCKLTDWTFTRYHTPGKSEYAVGTAQSPKMVRDALPQAAESAPRPLPYGLHRWHIRTTRCTACWKVQAAFATCPQPCSPP